MKDCKYHHKESLNAKEYLRFHGVEWVSVHQLRLHEESLGCIVRIRVKLGSEMTSVIQLDFFFAESDNEGTSAKCVEFIQNMRWNQIFGLFLRCACLFFSLFHVVGMSEYSLIAGRRKRMNSVIN